MLLGLRYLHLRLLLRRLGRRRIPSSRRRAGIVMLILIRRARPGRYALVRAHRWTLLVGRRLIGREVMRDGANLLLLERGHNARHKGMRVRRCRGPDAGMRGGGIVDMSHELGMLMILLMLYMRLLLTVLDGLR